MSKKNVIDLELLHSFDLEILEERLEFVSPWIEIVVDPGPPCPEQPPIPQS